MVVFLPQLTMINIEISANFPSGNARGRGGASRMKGAIGKITGGVRCFAARANVLLDTHEAIAGFLPWSRKDRLVHHTPEIGPDALVCRVTGQAPEWLGRRLIRVGRSTPLRDCLAQLGVGKG